MNHLTPKQCLDYVLDQLPDPERLQVEDHAAHCPACYAALAAAAEDELAFRDALQTPIEDVPTGGGPSISPWFRPLASLGGFLAIAAVLLLFFRPAPLPDYTLTVTPATRSLRSHTAPPMIAGQPIDIVLRPMEDASPPRVTLLVEREGKWFPLKARVEVAATGAVRAHATAPHAPGTYTLVALIAPGDASTDPNPNIQPGALPAGWQRLEEEVTFLPSP